MIHIGGDIGVVFFILSPNVKRGLSTKCSYFYEYLEFIYKCRSFAVVEKGSQLMSLKQARLKCLNLCPSVAVLIIHVYLTK